MESYNYHDVGLLITHYNRSSSLERLLEKFNQLNCSFAEIVVSDDGSSDEHHNRLLVLRDTYNFKLVRTKENKGLGHNLNKGQDAVGSPLTLYVQEDFVPTDIFPDSFSNAVELFRERHDLDIIRFYAYYNYPYLKNYRYGYSEMLIKPWYLKYRKIYYYSDHPHLRRSSFLEKFGRYEENLKGDRTEYRKCIEFIQKKGKGLFYNEFTKMFNQLNSGDEPSTMSRTSLSQTNNPLISFARDIYRQLKYNYDIWFYRTKI